MTFLYLPMKFNNWWVFVFGLVLSLSEENDLSYDINFFFSPAYYLGKKIFVETGNYIFFPCV